MDLTSDQAAALDALLASGLKPADIVEAAREQSDAKARAASFATIPKFPTISADDQKAFQSWLLDGQGSADARGEATLAMQAMLQADPSGAAAHTFQLLKNVVFFCYPDIGAAILAQVPQIKLQTKL